LKNVRKGQFTSQSKTQDMTSHDRNFGQLKIGAVFQYQGQTYRKESENSAMMLRWANGDDELSEHVSHRFFAEIVVQISDSEDESKN
jgi:hypothetical protein